ncbi:ABC transporter ATP-binding protein [Chelatococcus asaccharovorans]|uniref:ATP-binding cassette subfamily B protein n=1 Tax=Chelatococcus asaccharovorans TaxID=28210 RepID=A0A2V3TW27_9HYPH|nr:ABC transporter ATP-binding protein [Chelatococcus asaccharovorans]MBS7706099.1 ABC transporter ATP-binding protein [Chelatococcus asaccharovorans]PXW52468.1 ATP-binding cassette subfamily B protein [Chelatococcus asaccharovorans]
MSTVQEAARALRRARRCLRRKPIDLRADTVISVFRFTGAHWAAQRGRVSAIILFGILATAAEVLTPYFAGRLVDAIARGSFDSQTTINAAWTDFSTLLALSLGAVILRQFVMMNIVKLTLRIMGDMATETFARVQRLSTDWYANSFAGSTVRKISRGMGALDLLSDTVLIALLSSAVTLVGATLLLGSIWPVMGLVIGFGSLVFIVVTCATAVGYVFPAAALSNAWDTKLGGALADAVTCNAVVKAFGAERREETKLARVISKWRDRTARTWNRSVTNLWLQGLMMVSMQAAMLASALVLWQRGAASPGDITFVLTLFFIVQGHLRDVGMHIHHLQRSVNEMEEMVKLHEVPIGVADRPGARPADITRGEIVFDHVTFRYGTHPTPLYRDFSIRVKAGEKVGLVGHSGSGKTTFARLVQRLYDVTGGAVLIDGQNIADLQQASLRRRIAIVQQEPILFHRSLAENIAYARPDATREEIIAAAKQASAHGFITKLPKGYETQVGERGVKLSGGERQRVALARAFLADAPILILDEATSSLDSESEALIQQAMEKLMVGRTTIVIAHRLSTVQSLDRLLVFDVGRVVEEGSHAALIRRPDGLYRRLFERQALELTKSFESV